MNFLRRFSPIRAEIRAHGSKINTPTRPAVHQFGYPALRRNQAGVSRTLTITVRGQVVGGAGIASGANTGAAVTDATASYNASYEYLVVDNVRRGPVFIQGDVGRESGNIQLSADFNNGTLTGTSGNLDVNGTINGTAVGGTARAKYRFFGQTGLNSGSVTTDLDGQIGTTGVIGVIHGDDSDTVVVGGIVGTRN